MADWVPSNNGKSGSVLVACALFPRVPRSWSGHCRRNRCRQEVRLTKVLTSFKVPDPGPLEVHWISPS